MSEKTTENILNGEADIRAAEEIVRRELKRQRKDSAKNDRKGKQLEKKQLAAIEKMQKSISTIKWLMVGNCVVVVIGLAVIGWSAMETQRGVSAIEEKSTRIEADVAGIEEKIETMESSYTQPVEKLGRMIGEKLDAGWQSMSKGTLKENKE